MSKNLLIGFLGFLFSGCNGYKVENGKVYYKSWNEGSGSSENPIKLADAVSFEKLQHSRYGKDKNHVFYEGSIIENADAGTFKSVEDFYGVDSYSAFYGYDKIDKAQGKSFRVIEGNYSKDDNEVFFKTKAIGSSDPNTFEILKIHFDDWTRDKYSYYFEGKKIPIKDYVSFAPFRYGFGKDKFYVYFKTKIIPELDVKTFEMCGDKSVGQDKDGRHDGQNRIPGPCKK